MIRVVFENILLFLTPAAIYVGYVLLVKKTGQNPREVLDEAPLVYLFLAGVALIAVTLIVFGTYGARDEGEAGKAYEPPVYKDGKIIPGRVK